MKHSQWEALEGSMFGAGFLWIVWGWWSFSGPYRWAAIAEMKVSGSFGAILTFFISFVLLFVVLLAASKLLEVVLRRPKTVPVRRPTPEEAKAKMEAFYPRGAMVLTAVSLIVTLACGLGLFRFYHRTALATLDVSAPTPLPSDAGLVQLKGFTRPEFLVGISSKNTGDIESHSSDYMAIVGEGWQPGQPVPAVVEGSPGEGMDYRTFESAAPGTMLPYLLPKGAIRSVHSGFAEYLLERRGAVTDSHTVFLSTGLTDERDLLWVVLGFSCLFLVFGAFMLRGSLKTARSKAQLAAPGQ